MYITLKYIKDKYKKMKTTMDHVTSEMRKLGVSMLIEKY